MATGYVPYQGPIVTRAEAKAAGLKRFFLGTPCAYGHISQRLTSNNRCFECARIQRHAWMKANRQKVNSWKKRPAYQERDRQRQAAKDPEIKRQQRRRINHDPAKLKARKRRHQLKHAEQISAYLKVWRTENAEHVKQLLVQWVVDHPEAVRIHRLRAKTNRRQREVVGGKLALTLDDVARMQQDQDGRCLGCGCDISEKYTLDHKIPLSRGGTNATENFQLLCQSCNSTKGTRTMEEWAVCKAGLKSPSII